MNFGWSTHVGMNHAGSMQWHRPPSLFQAQRLQGPPAQPQPGPWGLHCTQQQHPRQPTAPMRSYRQNPVKQKRPRKEPTYVDFCDVCDRGFKNNAKKLEHYKQHVKCDEPGCSFEAHFKIVAMHKQNLHGPDAVRIKLETPEEIKRWREERKRKYPSSSNIAKKAEKLTERERQGNILNNKDFSKMRHKRLKPSKVNVNDAVIPDVSNPSQSLKQCHTTPKSLLLSNPLDSSGEISSEDEDVIDTVASGGNVSALGSLMQNYTTSSDSEPEVIPIPDIKKLDVSPEAKMNESAQSNLSIMDSSEQASNSDNKSESQKHDLIRSSKPPRSGGSRGKKRQSLLEMLLANDIRKERNHILQCVRYVVENNFFQPIASSHT